MRRTSRLAAVLPLAAACLFAQPELGPEDLAPGIYLVAARDLKDPNFAGTVVVLTAYGYPQYAEAALRLGASGFVLKNGPIEDLLAAIRAAASGNLHFGVRPGQRLALSERELDVVRKVVEGRSNDEIGADLGIAPKTVESHLRRIFERVDVTSRTELATRALREGWLDLPG